MNLYKFNFDLAGSSNALKTITIPSDSKYSIGLKFFIGSEELVLGDDVKITIQDDKYIYTPTEIFNNYAVFAGSTHNGTKTYRVNFHKDGEPEVDVNFKGITVRTNESKISNWAITDSQMKVVYTDEWESMKDNADDRVIYFVVDRPTPPKPVPPKPTPVPPTPGGMRFGIRFSAQTESDEFDPNSVEDCLNKDGLKSYIKYTRDGVDHFILMSVHSSPSAEVYGDAVKVDQIDIPFEYNLEDDGKGYLECQSVSFENNKIYMRYFGKEVSSQEEANELMRQYVVDRFGEEGTLPNTTNPLPSDIDDWKIVYEEENETQYTITDEYVYIPGLQPEKMLINSETFPQWIQPLF